MLRQALDYPTSGEHGPRSLLLGSALLLLAAVASGAGTYAYEEVFTGIEAAAVAVAVGLVSLLALLAVRGYYYRALAVAANAPDPTAPPFGNVGALLKQGIVSTLLSAVYLVPAAILFALAAGTTRLDGNVTPDVALVGESVGAIAALVGIAALVAALYLTPAAMAHVGREGSALAGLHVRTVTRGAASEDYAVGWVVATALQWVFGPIAIALSTLVVGVVLYFLTGVAARYLWGSTFGSAAGFGSRSVPTEGITPPSERTPTDEAENEPKPAVRRVELDSTAVESCPDCRR